MKILRGIPNPFAGEHVLRTLPPLGPYAAAAAGAPPLRRRLHFFAQRALTHSALTDEQRSRIGDAMRLGESVAPGVIDGFEAALDGAQLVLAPGHAIAPDGQDIELAYPLRLPFDAVPVFDPRVDAALANAPGGSIPWQDLSTLQRQATLRQVLDALDGATFLPRAMVLTAVPRSIALDRESGAGPCPNAAEDSLSMTAAWEDGMQLAWVPWPADRPLPPWTDDGSRIDPRWRNRLAYAVFNAERERLSASPERSMRRWVEQGALSPAELDARAALAAAQARRAEPWPWETLGVPLSLVGFDADFRPAFADRASVVRQGGGRRNRSALVPWSGDDVLWQARVAQLVEHLSELPQDQRTAPRLVKGFDWLPPAGVLPRELADLIGGRQAFFPPTFDVQALPVPLDMVDALLAESAPLAPFNLSLRDQVQLLVPVPSRHFEPDLLQLDLPLHPLFDREITRLGDERLKLLTERDGLRRRADLLTQCVGGSLPAYPLDDPNALADETGAQDAMAFQRVHRMDVAPNSALVQGFTGAHQTLPLDAADELIVFVRIDAAPAGIGIRPLIGAMLQDTPPATHAFVWGRAPADAGGERIGELPAVGEWVRLAVSMKQAGLGGHRIDGLAFAVFGGSAASRVTWGHAGKAGAGLETVWVGDALPPGAEVDAGGPWTWVDQGEAADAAADQRDGLPVDAKTGARGVSELERLLGNWRSFRDGVLTVELGEPASGERTPSTPPRPVDAGLDELISRLDGRIRAAGDHIDFGFLRARTDIFRLRQSLLGTADAGRFLTSAAAADLVTRNDNPVATEKEFADYFKRLDELPAVPPVFKTAPSADAAPRPMAAARSVGTAATSITSITSTGTRFGTTTTRVAPTTTFVAPTTTFVAPTTTFVAPTTGFVSPVIVGRVTPADIGRDLGPVKIAPDTVSVKTAAAAPVKLAPLTIEPPPLVSDVAGASLLGATYNTVTVAERFTAPAAVVASNSAAKGKNDFVVTGVKGLTHGGLVVDDLPVFGYRKTGDDGETLDVKAGDLISGLNVFDLDAQDVADDTHEAVYFRRGIDAIDNTVRFLRGIELRAEDYRRLQADARLARERIGGVLTRLQQALASLALRLAEVRHDLGVARALRDEELARLAAIVARRKAVLAEQVPYLVFRRPRLTERLDSVPLLPAQPAELPDPVPRCRAEAPDAPPELLAMVDTLRELPVRWLRPVAKAFVGLDRVQQLDQLMQLSVQRLQAPVFAAPVVQEAPNSLTGSLLTRSFERQSARVSASRQGAAEQLVQIDGSSWKRAIAPAQSIATVRDLMLLPAPPRALTLAAAGLLDDVAAVASCLHQAFSDVPPATRLRWAELFSQLDPAASLRVLTVLPGFGDEALGVDYIAWHGMQRLVDWLFAQVSDEADAQAAINELVRVCVLLAAHAPVRRILSARIRRPVPALPGSRLELALDPKLTRIGMQVLVQAPGGASVLARAVIDDLGADMASAVIVHSSAPAGSTLGTELRVQLQTGPALTTPSRQQADRARALAAAAPAPVASPVAPKAAPAPPPAAERRVARQVEKLAGRSLLRVR